MNSITLFAQLAENVMSGQARFDVRPRPPAGLTNLPIRPLPGAELTPGERVAVHIASSRLRRRVDTAGVANVGDLWPFDTAYRVRIINPDGSGQIEWAGDADVLIGTVVVGTALPIIQWGEQARGDHISLSSHHAVLRSGGKEEDITEHRTKFWGPGKWAVPLSAPERFSDVCPVCRGATEPCPMCYDSDTEENRNSIKPIPFAVDHQINVVPVDLIP